ncbi:hypothetical protein DL96DRAFT_1561843 [Flagelloscypha sp. PMI_526]|nr:hypothetical protein DL96DRAFT_1561843 [Flagelloscypha sp. PMI_526]
MSQSIHGFPTELYPGIIHHASTRDLKVYALVNSFFQSLAQPALFSVASMFSHVDERLCFFETRRGSQLLKHARILHLGQGFSLFQDHVRTSSFLRALDHPKIHSIHFFGHQEWHYFHEMVLNDLYTLVMPHVRTLAFSSIFDIPFIEVLSHCVLLRDVELSHFSTSSGNVIKRNALPNIRHLNLWGWDTSKLGPGSSLRAYLEVKGSSIQELSIGRYDDDRIPFSIDLFATLQPSLCELSFDKSMLHYLIRQQHLRTNELPLLKCVYFTFHANQIKWTVFLEFLDRCFEQTCFPTSLRDIYVRVVGDYGCGLLGLAVNSDVCLHVIVHKRDGISTEIGRRNPATIEQYDMVQREIEASLSQWVQTGRFLWEGGDLSLVVGRDKQGLVFTTMLQGTLKLWGRPFTPTNYMASEYGLKDVIILAQHATTLADLKPPLHLPLPILATLSDSLNVSDKTIKQLWMILKEEVWAMLEFCLGPTIGKAVSTGALAMPTISEFRKKGIKALVDHGWKRSSGAAFSVQLCGPRQVVARDVLEGC